MRNKFVLISGSASLSCSEAKLDKAIEFVQYLVGEILRRGGGLVLLASDESSTMDVQGRPHIFDWVALRGVEQYVESAIEHPRTCAQIIMSDQAVESRLDDRHLRTLTNLEHRGVVKVHHIRREEFTGGEYRLLESKVSDAMVAIGGGKGTYNSGIDMLDAGKLVLPMDLKIGALSEDGDGAISLHRDLIANPSGFFRHTHEDIVHRIHTLSMDREIYSASEVAQRAAELLSLELESRQRSGIMKFLSPLDTVVGKFVTWVGLARAIEFLKGFINSL